MKKPRIGGGWGLARGASGCGTREGGGATEGRGGSGPQTDARQETWLAPPCPMNGRLKFQARDATHLFPSSTSTGGIREMMIGAVQRPVLLVGGARPCPPLHKPRLAIAVRAQAGGNGKQEEDDDDLDVAAMKMLEEDPEVSGGARPRPWGAQGGWRCGCPEARVSGSRRNGRVFPGLYVPSLSSDPHTGDTREQRPDEATPPRFRSLEPAAALC